MQRRSLDRFIAKSNNIGLGKHCVCGGVDACIRCVILWQVHLRLVVDPEVGEFSLSANRHLASDVGHLEGLLAQVPFVPVIVRLNVFVNEVDWSCDSLVDHERC